MRVFGADLRQQCKDRRLSELAHSIVALCAVASADIAVECNRDLRYDSSALRTRCLSLGITVFSNHGLRSSQILLRGLGCGSGIMPGQYERQSRTVAVSEPCSLFM